jgi:hypothetical protein
LFKLHKPNNEVVFLRDSKGTKSMVSFCLKFGGWRGWEEWTAGTALYHI